MRPAARMPKLTRRSRVLIAIALAVVLLLLIGPRLVDTYVDWLWFGELGYRSVFTTQVVTRLAIVVVTAGQRRQFDSFRNDEDVGRVPLYVRRQVGQPRPQRADRLGQGRLLFFQGGDLGLRHLQIALHGLEPLPRHGVEPAARSRDTARRRAATGLPPLARSAATRESAGVQAVLASWA